MNIWTEGEQARFKCTDCGGRWSSPAGPTVCIYCGCVYVMWVNHKLTIENKSNDHTKERRN